jgi:tetratricopeptide (TPR) repeat protein
MRIALESPVKKRALLLGLFLLTTLYLTVVTTQLVADWLSNRPQLGSLRAATKLDPGNADYYYRLGRYYDLVARDPAAAIEPYQAAVRLNPQAHFWLALADAYQVVGNVDAQTHAIEQAVQADPSTPDVAWEAANLYLVQGLTDKALREFHVVMEGAPYMSGLATQLCWRVSPDADVLLREVIPADAGSYLYFLGFLMAKKESTDVTAKVWDGLVHLHQPFEVQSSFEYIRYLLFHKEVEEAALVWRQAASLLGLNAYLPSSDNLIVNGDFHLDVLNGGFDWQYRKQSSVSLTLDNSDLHAGHRSLAIVFDGPGVEEAGVYQVVAVEPNTTYEFSAYYKNAEIEGAGGPHFSLQDLYAGNTYFLSDELKYGSSWKNVSGGFTTSADTRALVLRVPRIPAGGAIRGKLWIGDFRLTKKLALEESN